MAATLKLLVVEGDITHLERIADLLKQLKAEGHPHRVAQFETSHFQFNTALADVPD